ncbi:hypothetical protein ON010_g11008 [Phytophthora cinnamomi]|nr:hypothetical protein ON010_g11008 [Phytophthora cinnamomi]
MVTPVTEIHRDVDGGEGHGGDADGELILRGVARYSKRTDPVDRAEQVQRNLEVLEGEELLSDWNGTTMRTSQVRGPAVLVSQIGSVPMPE